MPINRELYTTNFYNDANLVSYWRMEGNSNDSKSTNNGSDTSVTYGAAYGKFGQGANFSESRILLPDSAVFKPTNTFSISTWFNTSDTSATKKYIFSNFNYVSSTAYGYTLRVDDSNLGSFVILNGSESAVVVTLRTVNDGNWHHLVGTWDATTVKIYLDGTLQNIAARSESAVYTVTMYPAIGCLAYVGPSFQEYFTGNIDDLSFWSKALTADEVLALYGQDKNRYIAGIDGDAGSYPSADNSSLDTNLIAWKRLQPLLRKSANGGQCFSNGVVSTYPLVYTADSAYYGGVLSPNGDIYFVPFCASVGQKISTLGIISTYSLIYTNNNGAYIGGVLAPNGDIHFIPHLASVGQKISSSGIVSTYSLVYTTDTAYYGGVLAPNGDIHFIPCNGEVGQKISATGVVSTYSLVYTNGNITYYGGVLAPNGDIHFIPCNGEVGQKISATGVVSTYSLVYTNGDAYRGGVLASNGDIHFSPYSSIVGQKVSISGVVSTYSYENLIDGDFTSGVLSPNGDIYFIPNRASQILKISKYGQLSTFALPYFGSFTGILNSEGNIYLIPAHYSEIGQKISTLPGIPFDQNICLSPFFNKF